MRQNISQSNSQGERIELFLIIFSLFLILHCVIFHDILLNLPELLTGNSVIVRDELVPFFDFNTQFFDQMTGGNSALTMTDEMRVFYSFWTSWLRYFKILPFSIIILNSISAFILFLSVFIILQEFLKKNVLFVSLAAFSGSLFIHLILLYSKVTHFYTLIFGFSLFSLALSLSFRELFFRTTFSLRQAMFISLLILFNPAIHYHILYYPLLALAALWAWCYAENKRREFWRIASYIGLIVGLSLVPYILFIYAVTSLSSVNVANSIPVNYFSIWYSSSSLRHLWSFDIAGPIDMFFHGFYLVPTARYLKVGSFILAFIPIVLFTRKNLVRNQKKFIIFCYFLLMLSIFTSIGYLYQFSFHSIAAQSMGFLSFFPSFLGSIFQKIMGLVVQILRYPHRFMFVMFYFSSVLIGLSFIVLGKKFKAGVVSLIVPIIIFSPFLLYADYRSFLLSGDYGGFLKPFEIPNDLKVIKKNIDARPGTSIILPTLESGRAIKIDDTYYNFLDKFLIYYLNTPVYYYGTGAGTENKVRAFLLYQAIMKNEGWWQEVATKNLDITYIINPKTTFRELGQVQLPDIDEKIKSALTTSDRYSLEFQGEYFDLYKRNVISHSKPKVMVNIVFSDISSKLQFETFEYSRIYFPLETDDFLSGVRNKYVLTDNSKRAYYDLISFVFKDTPILYPSLEMVPFTDKLVPSTYYTNTPLSLASLTNELSGSNLFGKGVPDLINLTSPQFIGIGGDDYSLKFSLPLKNTGEYKLLLKASSASDQIISTIQNQKIAFKRVDMFTKEQDKTLFSFFEADLSLGTGETVLQIEPPKDENLLVHSITLVPRKYLYTETFSWTGSEKLKLIRTQKPTVFEVSIPKE